MSSSRTAAAGGIRAGFKNTKTTANYYHHSTTSALRSGGAAAPGGATIVTTTNARPTKLTTTTMMEEMISKTDVFIFDCDGVIWRVRFLLLVFWPDLCLLGVCFFKNI